LTHVPCRFCVPGLEEALGLPHQARSQVPIRTTRSEPSPPLPENPNNSDGCPNSPCKIPRLDSRHRCGASLFCLWRLSRRIHFEPNQAACRMGRPVHLPCAGVAGVGRSGGNQRCFGNPVPGVTRLRRQDGLGGSYRGSSRSRYQCRTTAGNHSSSFPGYRVIENRLIVR
jgi:hypothetical protein